MVDPVKLVSDSVAEVHQVEASALSFGQKWWWAVALGALVLGFVAGKL